MPQSTPPLPRLELSKLSAPGVVEEGGRDAQPHTPEREPRSPQRLVSWPPQPARSAGPTSGAEVIGRLDSTHHPQLVARPAGLAQRSDSWTNSQLQASYGTKSLGPRSIDRRHDGWPAAEISSPDVRASYGAKSQWHAAPDQLEVEGRLDQLERPRECRLGRAAQRSARGGELRAVRKVGHSRWSAADHAPEEGAQVGHLLGTQRALLDPSLGAEQRAVREAAVARGRPVLAVVNKIDTLRERDRERFLADARAKLSAPEDALLAAAFDPLPQPRLRRRMRRRDADDDDDHTAKRQRTAGAECKDVCVRLHSVVAPIQDDLWFGRSTRHVRLCANVHRRPRELPFDLCDLSICRVYRPSGGVRCRGS